MHLGLIGRNDFLLGHQLFYKLHYTIEHCVTTGTKAIKDSMPGLCAQGIWPVKSGVNNLLDI